jgi:hypothetical protein
MDANNESGETIPIRLFLGGFDLTPTFREVNKKYSTRYYLSLVLIDEGMCLHVLSAITMLTSYRRTPIFQTVGDCAFPTSPRRVDTSARAEQTDGSALRWSQSYGNPRKKAPDDTRCLVLSSSGVNARQLLVYARVADWVLDTGFGTRSPGIYTRLGKQIMYTTF